MRRLYEKKYNPLKEIDEDLFNEFWDIYNSAADEGLTSAPIKIDYTDKDADFYNELQYNNGVFAAFKTHRFQNDMASMLVGEDGKLKSFHQWEQDTATIRTHHVKNWLKTEYTTAVRRARLAAEWRQFEREKDILPNLEWLKTTAVTPGKDHEPFWGVILPINHPFWSQHRPGDRWGCKCGWRNTDAGINPPLNDDWNNPTFAPADGLDNNPGKDAMLFSFSHPYFAAAHWAYKKLMPKVKRLIKEQTQKRRDLRNYTKDKVAGRKLMIHKNADTTELKDNIATGRTLIQNYPNLKVRIREHIRSDDGIKNPEYEINGLIADAKRIISAKGITAGFNSAIKQGCKVIVIDFDKHLNEKHLYYPEISKRIEWRKMDFESGKIMECYIIHNKKAIRITKSNYNDKDWIEAGLKEKGM